MGDPGPHLQRVVRDVVGTPIKASDLEIGDLVNAEPEIIFADQDDAAGRRGHPAAGRQGQGRGDPRPDGARATSCRRRTARTGRSTASSATPRSAPTSAARSRCTSSTTHHLLCPCHQSTFDLADAGKVLFGPAARPLPQLPLTVDDEGYLVAPAATSPSRSDRASGSVADACPLDTSKIATTNRDEPATATKPSKAGAAADLGRRPARAGHAGARRTCARSSPTTGRSCSARSRCRASSSCC